MQSQGTSRRKAGGSELKKKKKGKMRTGSRIRKRDVIMLTDSPEDGGRGHEPWNAVGLQKLEKLRKWILLSESSG